MIKIDYQESQCFLYAILLHLFLYLSFIFVAGFFDTNWLDKDEEVFTVKTYDDFTMQKKETPPVSPTEKVIEETLSNLEGVKKKMLSFSVESPQTPLNKESTKQDNKDQLMLDEFYKDFSKIDEDLDSEMESIFQRSQKLETLSKVYGYIKRESIRNNAFKGSVNKEELKRSKKLLLAYEEYQDSLYKNILSNWDFPSYTEKDWECEVEVEQSPSGELIGVEFLDCVEDERFRRAIKIALLKTSPFTLPQLPEIFSSYLYFTFRAN